MLTETDYAYAAGIVDGEGCILIRRTKPSGGYQNVRHTLTVSVEMSEIETVQFLSQLFNKPYQCRDRGPGRKVLYVVAWSSNLAVEMLRKILPYMRGKKKQALTAIEFWENTRRECKPGVWLTEQELGTRDQYRHRLQVLKHRRNQEGSETTRVSFPAITPCTSVRHL
jgi:hypothetical protein